MNDKQIIEYVRDMIKANLNQYIETGDTKTILSELYNLDNDKNNEVLLEHIKGVKALLEKAEQIIERKQIYPSQRKNKKNFS